MSEVREETRQLAEGESPSVGRLWDSTPVRWSMAAGTLLAAGFVVGLADAPVVVTAGIYVVATVVGARFFATEALEELLFAEWVTDGLAVS